MTFSKMLSTMNTGMLRTGGIFALTLIGSLPLGMVVALLRKSRFPVIRGIIWSTKEDEEAYTPVSLSSGGSSGLIFPSSAALH